jgi:hypothetical protein
LLRKLIQDDVKEFWIIF